MAKKNKVTCKCQTEYNVGEVMSDSTIHTLTSYRFKFLGQYVLGSSGFPELIALIACPNCREETKEL